MKKSKLILIVLLANMISNQVFSQGGKTDKKTGARKGKWEIVYSLDRTDVKFYDPIEKIPDCFSFIKEIPDNGKDLKKAKSNLITEQCTYENGLKEGPFSLQVMTYQSKGYISTYIISKELMSGNYKNGKLDGSIRILTEDLLYLPLVFSEGKIIDQALEYGETTASNPLKYTQESFLIKEKIEFVNGTLAKIEGRNTATEQNNKPLIYIYLNAREYEMKSTIEIYNESIQKALPISIQQISNNIYSVLCYSKNPICYNYFPLLEGEKGATYGNDFKRFIDLNTNVISLEKYLININGTKCKSYEQYCNINGSYDLFRINPNQLWDTTNLIVQYSYTNGLRDGLAKIWDLKHAKEDNPFIVINFKNDILNGPAYIYSSNTTKDATVSMNFTNGCLDGPVISYWNETLYPFLIPPAGDEVIQPWIRKYGILMPYQVGSYNKEYPSNFYNILRFNPKYANITEYKLKGSFKVMEAVYKPGDNQTSVLLGDKKYYLDNNYCFYSENYLPEHNFFMYNEKGKIISSMNILTGNLEEAQKSQDKKNKEFLATPVKCRSCSKSVTIGDADITWGGCDCWDKNLQKVSPYGTVSTYFCSIQCKVVYEKDCCQRNGYSYER